MAEAPVLSKPPDWNTFKIDLFCPRCDYNLRMLTGSRCPECGLSLDWPRIVAAAENRLENPLFEYHWRERPVRSFFVTIRLCLRPWRLWTELPLTDTPNLPGLMFLASLVCVLYLLVYLAAYLFANALALFAHGLPIAGMANYMHSLVHQVIRLTVAACILHACIAFLIWLFLHIFQHSIMKHRIKRAQLWRLIIFAYIPVLLVKLLGSLSVLAQYSVQPWTRNTFMVNYVVIDCLGLGLFAVSLGLGMTRYLRVQRGWAIMTSICLIVLLALTTTDIVISTQIGTWDNPVNGAINGAWPGLTFAVGRLLGLN